MVAINGSTPIRLAFVPLNDCAPVAVAHELGIFERYGLDVRLSRQPGWASVRDMFLSGEIDAAESIAGIAFHLALGLSRLRKDVSVPLILSAHGNAITLSKELDPEIIGRGDGLVAFTQNRWNKNRPMTLAAAHRDSSHHILLHNWLKYHGLTPGTDVEIIFLPPPLMPGQLKAGHIDGYCVGEPWNSASILAGHGWCPVTSADISTGHPEKILLVDGNLLGERREETVALVAALLHACRLCQQTGFRKELIKILSKPAYTDCPEEMLRNSLGPVFNNGRGELNASNMHMFYGNELNCPSVDKASWFLSSMRSVNLLPEKTTASSLSKLYRRDIFSESEKIVMSS